MKRIKIAFTLLTLLLLLSVCVMGVSAASAPGGYDGSEDGGYYEEEYAPDTVFTPEGGQAFAIVLSAIFGILAPLIPIGYVIFMLLTHKKEVEPVDYVIISLSAVWLIAGVVLLLLFV